MDHPVFDHEGPWTEAAYLELPRNDRVEVIDGTLLVGPGTNSERATAVSAVRAAISAALPDGLRVRGPVSLRLGPDCILVPDLIVVSSTSGEPGGEPDGDESADDADEVLDASAALMVVEVVGREHGAVDRTFKPQLYAGCRIPYLMLIDYHGPFAIADMIISGRYHEYARAAGDEPLRLEEPFRLELDLRTTTPPEPAAAPEAGASEATTDLAVESATEPAAGSAADPATESEPETRAVG